MAAKWDMLMSVIVAELAVFLNVYLVFMVAEFMVKECLIVEFRVLEFPALC